MCMCVHAFMNNSCMIILCTCVCENSYKICMLEVENKRSFKTVCIWHPQLLHCLKNIMGLINYFFLIV